MSGQRITEQILVAGVGNIFLGDDAFGCELARELLGTDLTADVIVVDYGIRGVDLAYSLLKPWRAVILIDAISRGGTPGDLYLLQPAEGAEEQGGLDPHSMDPMRVLAMAHTLGDITAPIYIVGCEPLDFGDELEGRMALSSEVSAAIPEAISMTRALIAKLVAEKISEEDAVQI